ncbi:MAG: 50S ribosomal protein L21 [Phycisphaerae bacterium]|nr:50S ribosomal protein L21 [Phycisphaerae bacterium]
MYAVIEDSGQQFRVSEGDVLDVDLRDLPEDTKQIEFDRVLLVSSDDGTKIGTPMLDGAKVVGDIVDLEAKGPKVHSYYLRRRKASRKKVGHRQKHIRVKIAKISA